MQENLAPELSDEEKQRRFSLLREKLEEAGLSALVVYGGTQMGVSVHYLTQVWGNKNNMVFFPVNGEPIFLIPSNSVVTPRLLIKGGCWIPEKNICLSTNLTRDVAKIISSFKLQEEKIGIDSFRFWPVSEFQILSSLCPKVRLIDAYRLFGEIRGSKSAEELFLIEKAIRISEIAHYAFLANLKPGVTEDEVVNKVNKVLDTHEAGERIILIHSRPDEAYPYYPSSTVIQKPNPITFSPEFSRKTGYGAQMVRTYWWEKPKGVYKRMFELHANIRQMVLEEFKPGVKITYIGKKIKDLVSDFGFECDKLGHAVGVSYGDAPYITAGSHERDYMEWTVLPNEVYAVHPMVRCKGYVAPFTMIGDMYFIGKDKTKLMTTALSGLPEIIP